MAKKDATDTGEGGDFSEDAGGEGAGGSTYDTDAAARDAASALQAEQDTAAQQLQADADAAKAAAKQDRADDRQAARDQKAADAADAAAPKGGSALHGMVVTANADGTRSIECLTSDGTSKASGPVPADSGILADLEHEIIALWTRTMERVDALGAAKE